MYWFNYCFPNIWTGDAKNKTRKKLAAFENETQFINCFIRLFEDAMGRYSFEGLPETCSERVIKQALIYHGNCVFIEKEGSVIALPGSGTEDYNVYGEPKYGWVWGRNGFNERIRLYIPGADDYTFLREGVSGMAGEQEYRGVYVRENYLNYPFINYIIKYAQKITDTERALDVARSELKRPYIITAEQSILSTVNEFLKQRDANVDAIAVSSGNFDTDKIKLLPTGMSSDILKTFEELVEWYFNQFQLLCGYKQNTNTDKKAQISVEEIQTNDEYTNVQSMKTMECLQANIEIVNDVFGLNVKVVDNSETDNDLEENENEEGEEEKDNDVIF